MNLKIGFIILNLVLALVFSAGSLLGAETVTLQELPQNSHEQAVIDVLRQSDEREIDAIIMYLDDRRPAVRIEAAAALGRLKSDAGINALHNAMLHDQNAAVRYTALLAVIAIGSKESIPHVRQLKEKEQDIYIQDLLKKIEKKLFS